MYIVRRTLLRVVMLLACYMAATANASSSFWDTLLAKPSLTDEQYARVIQEMRDAIKDLYLQYDRDSLVVQRGLGPDYRGRSYYHGAERRPGGVSYYKYSNSSLKEADELWERSLREPLKEAPKYGAEVCQAVLPEAVSIAGSLVSFRGGSSRQTNRPASPDEEKWNALFDQKAREKLLSECDSFPETGKYGTLVVGAKERQAKELLEDKQKAAEQKKQLEDQEAAAQLLAQAQAKFLVDLRAGRVAPKSCAEWYYAKGQDVDKLTAPISSISLTPPKGTGKVTGEVMQISGRTLQIARFMPLVGIDYDEPAILLLGDKAKIFNGDKVRVGVNVLAYGSQASVRNGQTPVIQVACITAVTPSDQLNAIDQFFK
jgi:hypothetical protein